MYKHFVSHMIVLIRLQLMMVSIQFSIGLNYQKLYVNEEYTYIGVKDVPQCKKKQDFPEHIRSVNIFREEAKIEPCHCELHHKNIPSKLLWKYQYFVHNATTERFQTESPIQIEGCGPIYFSVINKTVSIKYLGKPTIQSTTDVMQNLPLRIVTDTDIRPIMLRCQNDEFDTNDLSSCEKESPKYPSSDTSMKTTLSQSSPFMTSSNNMLMSKNKDRLNIILPAVLIPVLLILLGIAFFVFYKKRLKDMDNRAILSNTIEVRQAKGKNTHLKIHNYENVHRPAVIEIVEKTYDNNINVLNHNYENVYKASEDSTVLESNGSLYSEVPTVKRISETE